MRNLKRALSLALAAIMVMGLMVVGASAASTYDNFTDKDEIVNQEAVNTMVSLGVLAGKDDGSYFDPTGTVTRGEMAKIIAVCLNGGKDPVLGDSTNIPKFSDVPSSHWAYNYIAYCVQQNIIAGRGDGTFAPDTAVTGSEAAKMFLCALGYRADLEGLVGNEWELNTNVLANQDADLYDGLSGINPSEGLSRDNTAQMAYNAVQAQEVTYNNLYGDYTGVLQTQTKGSMLSNRFGVDKVEGVVLATDLVGLDGTTTVAGKVRLTNVSVNGGSTLTEEVVINNNTTTRPRTFVYPVDIDDSLLGQKVVLYVKGLKDLAPNASSTQVISEPIVSKDNTVVVTTGRLEKPTDVKDALKDSGIAMPTTNPTTITISDGDTSWVTQNGTQAIPGVEQTFIDNNADGIVDVLIHKNPALAKINTYSESNEKMNISGIGSVDFVDITNPEDVAQGDYVLVYNYDGTYALTEVETVSGQVTAYSNNATNPFLSKITIDGTAYGMGAGKNLAPDVQLLTSATVADTMKEMVDGTYTLYLDPHGNILGYVEDESVVGNYAIITGVNSTGSASGFYGVEVKMTMADGTTGKYDVNLLASANKYGYTGTDSKKESTMYNTVMGMKGKTTLVTYSLDGSTVTLIDPDKSTESYHKTSTNNTLILRNSLSAYTFDAGKLMADNKTVFFVQDKDGNYSVVNGLNNLRANDLTSTGTSQAIYYQPVGSTMAAKAIYVEVTDSYTSNSNYAFVYGDYSSKTVGTDTIYTYPVVLEDGTISSISSKTDNNVSKKDVHEYQVSGDYVTFDNQTTYLANDLQVTAVGNGSISVADADDDTSRVNSYAVLSTAKIWNVEDVDAEDPSSVFALEKLQKLDKVALVFDSDFNVKAAFVYDRLDGDLAPATGFTVKFNNATTNVKAEADGSYTVAPATSSQDLAVAVAPAAGQTVNVTAKVTGGEGNGTLSTTLAADGKNITTSKDVKIYTAGTPESGTEITITITTAQDGYAPRTTTLKVVLYTSGSAGVPTDATAPTTVTLKGTGAGNSATVTSGTTITAGASTDFGVTYGTGADQLFFDVVPNGNTVKSLSLTKDGKTVSVSAGGVFTVTGSGKYVLTVTVGKDGEKDAQYTYTANITATSLDSTLEATLPTGLATDCTGTGTITVPAATVGDQSASLTDGTLANGAFTGVAATGGHKLTWLEVRIPFTKAQYEASTASSKGLAIKQTNSALTNTNWSTALTGGVKDKYYDMVATNDGTGLDGITFNNGVNADEGGYISLFVLVDDTNPTIKIQVKYGVDSSQNYDTASGVSEAMTINVDTSKVTFQ